MGHRRKEEKKKNGVGSMEVPDWMKEPARSVGRREEKTGVEATLKFDLKFCSRKYVSLLIRVQA